MTRKPLVSVIIITYNQENYIGQALESIVTQKTSFEFEVLVGDDMSTDKTPAIISDFAQRYPAIIKPIIRKKNLGPAPNFVETLKLSQGRYIAICEGDDYWTDPLKLQRQADFLDANPDCVVCFHPVRVIYENGTHEDEIYPVQKDGFTLERLVEGNFIQTNSVMYRATNYNDLPDDILPLDWYLHLYHAKMGGIGFIDKTMAVYRRHKGGIWWSDTSDDAEYKFLQKNYIVHQKFYARASDLLDNEEYSRQMQHHAIALLERVLRLNIDKQQSLLIDVVKRAPETLQFALNGVSSLISDLYKRNYDQAQELLHQKELTERLGKTVSRIQDSRSYKLSKIIVKPINVIRRLISTH
jgi:glycosyltransferase involved in cell wall biosynthesis